MNLLSFLKFMLVSALFGLFAVFMVVAGVYFYLKPELPSMEALQDVRFHIPLKVYSRDEKLIAEFGEQRRTPIRYEEVPDLFIKAVMAAEDQNFFKHKGVDIKALTRAVKLMIENRGSIRGGGGSTITMQLTRALFLNKDRKFKRKFKEIILTIQLERELSKEEILELYFNEIFLGKRAYGIQAAANVYYDKNIDQLSLAQLAMIAGLPKAPAANNPVNNPSRALTRRNWILGRMLSLQFINQLQYDEAIQEPVTAKDHGQANELEAPYLAEMVRNELYQKYGPKIYTGGYKAYTTLDSNYQHYANQALTEGVHSYNERHGYKGVVASIQEPDFSSLGEEFLKQNKEHFSLASTQLKNLMAHEKTDQENATQDKHYDFELLTKLLEQQEIDLTALLKEHKPSTHLKPALVLLVDEENQVAICALKNGSVFSLPAEEILWAAPFLDQNAQGERPEKISQVFKAGDVIHVRKKPNQEWRLAQETQVQSAFVALNPNDGAILALVGGYDYYESKYNRVIQSDRQAGSSFKPFIYTKALETGHTAASLINDAPVVFEDAALEETWKPENSSGKFYGPTRLRQALYRSRNLVSIRILRKLGIQDTIASLDRFGFPRSQLPANLSLSLGSASLTPMQVVTGYSTFANGGYRIEPYYLQSLVGPDGTILQEADPLIACIPCLNKSAKADEQKAKEITNPGVDTSIMEPGAIEQDTGTLSENTVNDKTMKSHRQAEAIIEPRVNYIIDSILADVVVRGTGYKARELGRKDIRGKTGTTNDQIDAWFTGYNGDIVASAWVGFDSPQSLGRGEYGASTALPIWYDFMAQALKDKEENVLPRPDKLVTVKIDAQTGEAAKPGDLGAIFEIFREEFAPQLSEAQKNITNTPGQKEEEIELLDLF